MKTLCAAVVGFGVALASSASANTWFETDVGYADFDVSHGYYCAIRSFSSWVSCAQGHFNSPLVDYPFPAPVLLKGIAMDSRGYVFVVGFDDVIYNEAANNTQTWQRFPVQPGLSCVQKIVAIGNLGKGTHSLLALGCDANKTVKIYLNGSWSVVSTGTFDIAVTTDNADELFELLGVWGNASVWTGRGVSSSWTMAVPESDAVFPGGTQHLVRIGGLYGATTGVPSYCHPASGQLPTYFWGLQLGHNSVALDPLPNDE